MVTVGVTDGKYDLRCHVYWGDVIVMSIERWRVKDVTLDMQSSIDIIGVAYCDDRKNLSLYFK